MPTAGCERFDDDSWIHSVHGNLARDAGDTVTALASYRRSAELLDAEQSPDTATAWMNVADAAATVGDDVTVKTAFERASALAVSEDAEQLGGCWRRTIAGRSMCSKSYWMRNWNCAVSVRRFGSNATIWEPFMRSWGTKIARES